MLRFEVESECGSPEREPCAGERKCVSEWRKCRPTDREVSVCVIYYEPMYRHLKHKVFSSLSFLLLIQALLPQTETHNG
jgi:hypothetical protein